LVNIVQRFDAHFLGKVALVLLLVAYSVTAAQEPTDGTGITAAVRQWTDDTGQYRVQARLLEHDGDTVVLETEPGQRISVPVARLSLEDQRYLRLQTVQAAEYPPDQVKLCYVNPVVFRVRIGLEVSAPQAGCSNLVATFPLPMSWPEQVVEVEQEEVSPGVQRVTSRVLNDGVRQVEFRVPRLVAGQSAHVIYTLRVQRFQVLPPEQPQWLRFAAKPGRDLRPYLGESPFIETNHPKVKAAADEMVLDPSQTAWQQVETIYDWTRARISHYEGVKPLQGALQGLETGSGDCEEITSLFVAMCRLKGVPARSVWVQEHTYPEFYLEDPDGQGVWIPCESLGARVFGGMPSYRLVLQKGDRFTMAQKRGPQRYVTSTISGTVDRDGAQPVLREILEIEEIQ
jgi:transglutaminase-like putative cysteine protease